MLCAHSGLSNPPSTRSLTTSRPRSPKSRRRYLNKIHALMYQKAKEAVVKGQDLKLGEVHVSPVCGFIGGGEPSDSLPCLRRGPQSP